MYMNNKKRNLILAAAIVNLIGIAINLVMSILMFMDIKGLEEYLTFSFFISYSSNLVFAVLSFAAGLVASILLLYSIRNKGKYFRGSYGIFITGFIMIIICGTWLAWLLLFISFFIPDIIVMNNKAEMKQEEKATVVKEKEYEEKKKRIEDLKRMRDNGLISEEEYKEKLFQLL